jgi:hypothetical protein
MRCYSIPAFVAAVLLLAISLTASSLASPISAGIVVKDGDALGPSTVTILNAPFTNGLGSPGFFGRLADGQGFIWCGAGPVFLSGDALPLVLTGGESTMGISDTCAFVYSPSVDGKDALYTNYGVLIEKGDSLPMLPGRYSSFNSRPTMLPDGTCWWMGGSATTPTGSTTNRHCFKAGDPSDPSSIQVVFSGGDVVDGKTISSSSTHFSYWVSDNGLHHIHILTMDLSSENIYLDGGLVAEEGDPTGQGDNWEGFDAVGVNNSGDYVFMGDTDGVTSKDVFIAYNGEIKVREGDTIDGLTMPVGITPRWASINNDGYIAFAWGISADEYLFYGYGPHLDMGEKVLRTGDSIDVDNDLIADYTVTDFNGSAAIGPSLDLATGGNVCIEVDLMPVGGGTEVEAILRLPVTPLASVDGQDETRPVRFFLLPGRPNPFVSGTILGFVLGETAPVQVTIYDVFGRRVTTLVDASLRAGTYTQVWDGRNAEGARVSAGTYFIRLQSNGQSVQQKVIHIR